MELQLIDGAKQAQERERLASLDLALRLARMASFAAERLADPDCDGSEVWSMSELVHRMEKGRTTLS